MTDGRKLFDKPINLGNYRFGYLLDYPYFKEYDKLITIDISK